MSRWTVLVPPRLYEEFAHLPGAGRKAVHDALARLAEDPRNPSTSREPIEGAELRQIGTEATADTGDRITLLYRVHSPAEPGEPGTVEVIWILSFRVQSGRVAAPTNNGCPLATASSAL